MNKHLVHPNDISSLEEALSRDVKLKTPLTSKNYAEATIVPSSNRGGVVYDCNKAVIDETAVTELFYLQPEFPIGQIKYKEEEVIYMGCLMNVFGHAITDNIKRFWYLQTSECKERLDKGVKIVYITYCCTTLSTYIYHIFSLLGVDLSSWTCVTEPTKYRNVIVPDNSFVQDQNGRKYSDEFLSTIDSLTNICCKSRAPFLEKIYLSRTYLKDKKDFGEQNIEKEFEKNGYLIIHPETLSIEEQVGIVHNCKFFAATLGSVSHLSLFCKDDAVVYILRKSRYINTYQCVIDSMKKYKVTYIDVEKTHIIGYPYNNTSLKN